MTRVQRNIVARSERVLLDWLCERLPTWVTPDQLTLVGVCGACLVFVSYILSRHDPVFLWLASFGYVVHWFGDSLDGSLARYRRTERPIYGYFLDHTVDAICNLLIMSGLGLTLHVRMDVALFALIGYYLLCIYVFINNHLSGVFKLSFLGFGPTELRFGLIALDTWIYFGDPGGIAFAGERFSYYDVFVFLTGAAFTGVFLVQMLIGIESLRSQPRAGTFLNTGTRPPHKASRNASSAAE